MDLTEKMINKHTVFKGNILELRVDTVQLPNGKHATREMVEHPGGVCIAALTENNELLFVRQYRYPYKEVLLELPAGKLEPGQDPLENGKRELLEETGAIGENYVSLGKVYPSPGYFAEVLHLYFCRVTEFREVSPDEDEFLEIEKIPLKDAVQLVLQNKIPDAKSQVAILKLTQLLQNGDI